MKKLSFLTTSGCHLCDQAWNLVERFYAHGDSQALPVITDIADDEQLTARYGTSIPVLLDTGSGEELRWPFSLAELHLWLEGMPGKLDHNWLETTPKTIDTDSVSAAHARQQQLTKPAGSLGELELVAETLAGLQGCSQPTLDNVAIAIFAADHGVAALGTSAFPQEVTTQMVGNFINGGAAIAVLAKEQQCQLDIIDMGTLSSPLGWQGVIDRSAGLGSYDMSTQPALSEQQLQWCLATGAAHIDALLEAGDLQLFIAGEMGIGNTTAAAAIGCALTGSSPEVMTGRGTGVDDKGLLFKQKVIAEALQRHQLNGEAALDPLYVLRTVGGLEIAAMCGAIIRCAQRGVPVLVDGFVVTAAALVAVHWNANVRDWLLFAHKSQEVGHKVMLETLHARPLCDLGLRLGEGSGAGVVLPLLRLACQLHNKMHTFAEAGVAAGEQ